MATAFKTPTFLGAQGGQQPMPMARSQPLQPTPGLSSGQLARQQQLLSVADQSGPVNSYMYRRRATMQPEVASKSVTKMPGLKPPAKPAVAKPKTLSGGYRTVTDYTNTGDVNVLSNTRINPKLQSKTGKIPNV